MGETKKIHMNELKVGRYIVVDGVACVVKNLQVSRPGKHGHAKYRVEATGIINNQKKVFIKPGHDTIDSPVIEKEAAQVLSVAGDKATVMDAKTYETFEIQIPENLKDKVKEGVEVVYWIILDDKVIQQVK